MIETGKSLIQLLIAFAIGGVMAFAATHANADKHCETESVEATTAFKVITRSLLRPNEAARHRVYWVYALDKLEEDQVRTIPLGDLDGVLFAEKAAGKTFDSGVVLPSGGDTESVIAKIKEVQQLMGATKMFDVYLATTRNRLRDQEVDYDFIVQGLTKSEGKESVAVPCNWAAAHGAWIAEKVLGDKG